MSEETAKTPAPAAASEDRGRRKQRVGVVTSSSMSKTIVVAVIRRVPHPKFRKIVKKTTKLYAHDEKSEAKVGDRVQVQECRPLSKLKRWQLVEVLKH
jgi:small subunit ribosomal protein S17